MQQAGCIRWKKKYEKKTRKNPTPPKTHNEIHSSPASATTSRRRATKHVPRVSPYSPASIDPEFVEMGLLQLSQSCKNDECYTHRQTDRQTDRQTNSKMAPCTHPGTSREVNEARWPHTCSRPCAFEEKRNRKKTHENVRRTQNTPRNTPQPGDRDQLETACDETRPTR